MPSEGSTSNKPSHSSGRLARLATALKQERALKERERSKLPLESLGSAAGAGSDLESVLVRNSKRGVLLVILVVALIAGGLWLLYASGSTKRGLSAELSGVTVGRAEAVWGGAAVGPDGLAPVEGEEAYPALTDAQREVLQKVSASGTGERVGLWAQALVNAEILKAEALKTGDSVEPLTLTNPKEAGTLLFWTQVQQQVHVHLAAGQPNEALAALDHPGLNDGPLALERELLKARIHLDLRNFEAANTALSAAEEALVAASSGAPGAQSSERFEVTALRRLLETYE